MKKSAQIPGILVAIKTGILTYCESPIFSFLIINDLVYTLKIKYNQAHNTT